MDFIFFFYNYFILADFIFAAWNITLSFMGDVFGMKDGRKSIRRSKVIVDIPFTLAISKEWPLF